jgi:pimeloyl-ACP methyl ester carboxylesterase
MRLEILSRWPDTVQHTMPLLFVHGAWHGAWCWDEFFLPYFAQHGYAAYAVSLRGHGASEGRKQLRWTTIADYVEDVAQAAAQAAAPFSQPPLVIGHSLGGLVIQKYLEKHPAPAAVLLASVPPHGALPFFLRFFRKQPHAFIKTVATMTPYHMVSSPALTRQNFFSADMPMEQAARYFACIQAESLRAALDIMLLALANPKRVKVPTLVLGAANDALFSVVEVALTAQAYHAETAIFADMAHDMMLEPNWQAVADQTLSWFTENGW